MTYPAFHQSTLGTFLKCPEQARVDLFEDRPRGHTDSTALGTAVHSGIQYALDAIIAGEPYGSTPLDLIEHHLSELLPWQRTKFAEKEVRRLARRAYENWDEQFRPVVEPASTEVAFNLPFPVPSGREVRVAGQMDCQDTRGFVIDWKTASRPYERWEYQRWAVQPTVYCYADSLLRPRLAVGEFQYAIMLHDGKVQQLDVTRDARHYQWLGQQIDRICDLIDADLDHWPLNDAGWHCSPTWCSNWDSCKGAVMGVDWKK